jgi:hypothetical protein
MELSSLLPSIPKGLGKKKTEFFHQITQRNRNGTYAGNMNTRKANIKGLRGLIKDYDGAENKRGTLNAKRAWAGHFLSAMESKYPIEKDYWEHEYPNNSGTHVLEIAPLPEGLDLTAMKAMIQDYLSHRLEFYKEAKRSLFVEDEFSEWFIEKVTGGQQIGKGHIAMDVKTGAGDGVDVFCIIMNKVESNEKSLIQNFKKTGRDLDILFKEQKFEEAIKMFMANYKEKLDEVIKTKEMRGLYYLGFVSTVDEVFLVNFKINVENIQHVGVKKATKGGVSIFLKNFIKHEHGNVKLYKSKKRIELRLSKAVVEHAHAVSIYKLAKPISSGEGDAIAEEREEVEDGV